MKYLKKFNQINESINTYPICHRLYKSKSIGRYKINPDGTVDVYGDVELSHKKMNKLPLKFGRVTGSFDCRWNQLTSLEGSPREVGGHFYCNNNQLTSLIGGPEIVGGDFYGRGNQLKSLVGVSENVKGNFYLSSNPVEIIYTLFFTKRDEFFNKINHIYTDLWLGDGWTIQGDIMEQIAEDLGVYLPKNWSELVEEVGYTII